MVNLKVTSSASEVQCYCVVSQSPFLTKTVHKNGFFTFSVPPTLSKVGVYEQIFRASPHFQIRGAALGHLCLQTHRVRAFAAGVAQSACALRAQEV